MFLLPIWKGEGDLMAPFRLLAIFPKMAASAHTPRGGRALTTVYGSLLMVSVPSGL